MGNHTRKTKKGKRRERNWFKTKERKTRLLSVLLHETLCCAAAPANCYFQDTLLVGQANFNSRRRKRNAFINP